VPISEYLATTYRPDREFVLVVEILSPDNTYSDTRERANDFLSMGVETIWIIDLKTRTARVCSDRAWTLVTRLEVAETPVYVDLETLFGPLDRSSISQKRL
jgi:Uma2 family endonuclease